MRVVVTGATGNAGTALLRAPAGEDAVTEVVGIAGRIPATAAPKTEWGRADRVVHLARRIQPSRGVRDVPREILTAIGRASA